MKELIKISKSVKTGNPVVSARDLHAFLGARQDFSSWFKGRVDKWGFKENVDFATIFYNKMGEVIQLPKNRELTTTETQRVYRIEYAITLDCAKELAMVQNNAKGKEARLYFIDVDKKYRALKEELVRRPELLYTMSETATCLSLSDYFGKIGRNSLYNILYHHKIVDVKNQPLQRYVKKGYFSCKPTRVTETGLKWLSQIFRDDRDVENDELRKSLNELNYNQDVLKIGVTAIVETLLYNKGGKLTEDKNRLAITHLRNFLEKGRRQEELSLT